MRNDYRKKKEKCQRVDDRLFYRSISRSLNSFLEGIEKTNFHLYPGIVKDEVSELYDILTEAYAKVEQVRKYL